MQFVDEALLIVEAGDGGDGIVAFRREKYVPFGGPAGGDGGRGGDVVLVGDEGLGTLHDLAQKRIVTAERGQNGMGKDMYGRAGADAVVRVPPGTVVFDEETGEPFGEITAHGERLVVAEGGAGGRGNRHFATSVDRAPRRSERGRPGAQRRLRLELKVMADVGLLGFPNVGKSTLIRAVSAARPRVANYPFTTLEPHLGVVRVGDARGPDAVTFVIADLPGLVEGASGGVGLGHRFLRHVERTRLLVHLVTVRDEAERSPWRDYAAIRAELERYDPELCRREEIVVMTKADLPEVRDAYPLAKERFAEHSIDLLLISAASHEGIDDLMRLVAARLARRAERAESE